MKRILNGAIYGILLCMMLTGCFPQTSGSLEADRPAREAEEPGTASEGVQGAPVTISFMIPQHPSMPAFGPQHLLHQEIEKRLGIRLNVINIVGADYDNRKNLMIASEEIPDIFFDATKNLSAYMNDGVILDLQGFIGTDAPNLQKVFADRIARYMCSDENGRILGVPEINQVVFENGIMCRKDWMDSLGLKPPETMDEMYMLLKQVKEKDPAGDGRTIPYATRDNNFIGITQSVTTYKNGRSVAWDIYDEKFVCDAISDEYREALVFLNRLYTERLMDREFATTKTLQWEQKVSSGAVGVIFDNLIRSCTFSQIYLKEDKTDERSFIILPPLPDRKGNRFTRLFNGIAGATNISSGTNVRLFAISSLNPHPRESIRFLDYFFTAEGSQLSNIGVEGVTFKKVQEEVKPILSADALSSKKYFTMGNVNWPGYKTWQAIDLIGGSTYDPIKEYVAKYGSSRTMEPVISLPSRQSEKVRTALSAIDRYVEECRYKFIMGAMNFSDWSKYTDRVVEMGIGSILEMYNGEYMRVSSEK